MALDRVPVVQVPARVEGCAWRVAHAQMHSHCSSYWVEIVTFKACNFGLQETAERNVELLRAVLPPHVLTQLRGGSRVLVERFNDV